MIDTNVIFIIRLHTPLHTKIERGKIRNKIKKILSFILTCTMLMGMSTTAFASEMLNVSTEAPTEANISRGLGRPNEDNCVNLTEEELDFAGEATHSTLYTNSYFTGKSSVDYSITNYYDRTLTVKIYSMSNPFICVDKIEVDANDTATGTISGLKADKKYYLTFSGPSHFTGTLK